MIKLNQKNEKVFIKTDSGYTLEADYAIIACGYESEKYLPVKVANFNSTYAIISKPIRADIAFIKDTLFWETKNPYIYFRTTSDNRIMIGGLDEKFKNGILRDKLIPKKRLLLEQMFKKLFPKINFQTDFAWAGTFGETKHGLPYRGSYNNNHILFARNYF